ncbi:MAG TPA: GH92 family glycosyl hydrolase [bacterium]|nr:GH92 family glycosyl hydrolase [bacterium]HPN43852.1 GH92 family glycosyl hydrolase [bacterium]
MKRFSKILLCSLICLNVGVNALSASENLNQYVKPLIGAGGHGHTFPGAALPFGMVQLSPDTGTEGWDWCSGYHYTDSSIMGFSHTHLSGTGVGDLGDILVMPGCGVVQWTPGSKESPDEGYRSRFSHNTEVAEPGFYSVILEDEKIKAELTITERVGFHKYTFSEGQEPHILFDLVHSINNRQVIYSFIRVENDSLITGYRQVYGWAKNRHIYFAAQFSRPFMSWSMERNGQVVDNTPEEAAAALKAIFNFEKGDDAVIQIKVALSPVSTAGALRNLQAEIPGWNFDNVKTRAAEKWRAELSRINVQADVKTKEIFYTALYHSLLFPSLHEDSDGAYRGLDQNLYQAKGFDNYTVFSLWDTFRALHPLLTIIRPELVNDLVGSMLAHYEQNAHHVLPVWSLAHNETWCMIGYHAVPVIADAYLKGIRNYDVDKAWEAIHASATHSSYAGLGHYMHYGYVPIDLEGEAASKTLEYAYDDWSIAQLAEALGKNGEAGKFSKRAGSYKNIFDANIGFMRGKKADGTWREPFDPFYAHYGSDFTEGNSWQYSWFVPQDIYGFINLLGGDKKFMNKLDQLFTVEAVKNADAPVDISGLIGQYAHGNEPSHHVAYLYNYAGAPWKAQERLHQIMTTLYDNTPEGICGNEDCGQMSAWYVFSAMGLYPVNPASSVYVFGTPVLTRAAIYVQDGKQFIITAQNLTANNKYIQSVTLNGKPYTNCWLSHRTIMEGGELVFKMGAKPNKKFATKTGTRPPERAF